MLALKDESLVSSKVSHLLDRQTFEQMRRGLRFSTEKKERKVRELANQLNERFKRYYLPEEFLSVQASPETREYLVFDAVKMYTMHVRVLCDEPNDFDLAVALAEDFKGKNHKLVMDPFYSSPRLLSRLKAMKVGAVGMVRSDKVLSYICIILIRHSYQKKNLQKPISRKSTRLQEITPGTLLQIVVASWYSSWEAMIRSKHSSRRSWTSQRTTSCHKLPDHSRLSRSWCTYITSSKAAWKNAMHCCRKASQANGGVRLQTDCWKPLWPMLQSC